MQSAIPSSSPRRTSALVTLKPRDPPRVVVEAPGATVAAAGRLKMFACPVCSGAVARVHRRLIDHVVSVMIFMPLRRYRCRSTSCGWHGNLKHAGVDVSGRGSEARSRGQTRTT